MRLALALLALALLLPATALADSGALLGESARPAALADAVTARGGDLSAIFFNPGALADLDRATLGLTVHGGGLILEHERDGEPTEEPGPAHQRGRAQPRVTPPRAARPLSGGRRRAHSPSLRAAAAGASSKRHSLLRSLRRPRGTYGGDALPRCCLLRSHPDRLRRHAHPQAHATDGGDLRPQSRWGNDRRRRGRGHRSGAQDPSRLARGIAPRAP